MSSGGSLSLTGSRKGPFANLQSLHGASVSDPIDGPCPAEIARRLFIGFTRRLGGAERKTNDTPHAERRGRAPQRDVQARPYAMTRRKAGARRASLQSMGFNRSIPCPAEPPRGERPCRRPDNRAAMLLFLSTMSKIERVRRVGMNEADVANLHDAEVGTKRNLSMPDGERSRLRRMDRFSAIAQHRAGK